MFDTLRLAEAWIAGQSAVRAAPGAGHPLTRIRDLLSRIERAEVEAQGGEAA
jgi:hypothetical protein